MKTLVIGYGNTLRSDDSVGFIVAEQFALLSVPHCEAIAVHQLMPELATEMALAEVVYFVDAWLQPTDKPQDTGKITQLCPNLSQRGLDHCWRPSLLLQYTQALYGRQPTAYQLLVPVTHFDYGEQLSPLARQGVDWALQTLQARVRTEELCYA